VPDTKYISEILHENGKGMTERESSMRNRIYMKVQFGFHKRQYVFLFCLSLREREREREIFINS